MTALARTFSAVVDAPLDEVFAWHARPGAFARLTPPWVPVRVSAETASLSDGRAVLALPGGMRWVARHDPAAYDPPRRFADELASLPLSAVVPWRHVHEFADAGPASTRSVTWVDAGPAWANSCTCRQGRTADSGSEASSSANRRGGS